MRVAIPRLFQTLEESAEMLRIKEGEALAWQQDRLALQTSHDKEREILCRALEMAEGNYACVCEEKEKAEIRASEAEIRASELIGELEMKSHEVQLLNSALAEMQMETPQHHEFADLQQAYENSQRQVAELRSALPGMFHTLEQTAQQLTEKEYEMKELQCAHAALLHQQQQANALPAAVCPVDCERAAKVSAERTVQVEKGTKAMHTEVHEEMEIKPGTPPDTVASAGYSEAYKARWISNVFSPRAAISNSDGLEVEGMNMLLSRAASTATSLTGEDARSACGSESSHSSATGSRSSIFSSKSDISDVTIPRAGLQNMSKGTALRSLYKPKKRYASGQPKIVGRATVREPFKNVQNLATY